jgi:hypothetical protein
MGILVCDRRRMPNMLPHGAVRFGCAGARSADESDAHARFVQLQQARARALAAVGRFVGECCFACNATQMASSCLSLCCAESRVRHAAHVVLHAACYIFQAYSDASDRMRTLEAEVSTPEYP